MNNFNKSLKMYKSCARLSLQKIQIAYFDIQYYMGYFHIKTQAKPCTCAIFCLTDQSFETMYLYNNIMNHNRLKIKQNLKMST